MWNENTSNNLFKLYRGIVEDNKSPSKDGRVRVRIFGLHSTDKNLVPTNTLPWAEFCHPLSFGFGSGIGITSIPRTGSMVFVILENDNPNNPIIIGGISGKNMTETGLNLPKSERLGYWDINDLANPGYPNNHVIETLGGHIIEIDDSSADKIRICHKNGNEVILNNEGISVTSVGNRTEITSGKFLQTVLNTVEINANGSISINTSGSMNISSNGVTNILANNDVNLKSTNNINIESGVDTNITVLGNLTSHVSGNSVSTVAGSSSSTVTGACSITANSGLTADVTGECNVTSSGAMNLTSSAAAKLRGASVTLQSDSNLMVI